MTSANVRTIGVSEGDRLGPERDMPRLQPTIEPADFAECWPVEVADGRTIVASHTRFERLDEYSDGTRIVSRSERSVYRALRGGPSAMVAAQPTRIQPRSVMTLGKAGLLATGIVLGATAGVTMLRTHEQVPATPRLSIALLPPTAAPSHASADAVAPQPKARATVPAMAPTDPAQGSAPKRDKPNAGAPTPVLATGADASDELATSVDMALAKGFATSDPQPWQNGDQGGMVVVGPAEKSGDALCRDVAVLTRTQGQPDQTVNNRRCVSPGGKVRITG